MQRSRFGTQLYLRAKEYSLGVALSCIPVPISMRGIEPAYPLRRSAIRMFGVLTATAIDEIFPDYKGLI